MNNEYAMFLLGVFVSFSIGWLMATRRHERKLLRLVSGAEVREALTEKREALAEMSLVNRIRIEHLAVLAERNELSKRLGEHWTDAVLKHYKLDHLADADVGHIIQALNHARYMGEIAAKVEGE